MFFKWLGLLAILLLMSPLQASDKSQESSVSEMLTLTPNKCVALRKGRACFATIMVKWRALSKGNYCLRRRADNLVIQCWQDEVEGDYLYVFRSEKKEELDLVSVGDQRIVVSSMIKVSWVYKSKRKKSRWRIF